MRRLRSEEGFTIMELMIVSLLSSIVVFAALSLVEGATRVERGTEGRLETAQGLRQAIMQTTKLTRQALSINPAPASTTSRLSMKTLVGGVSHDIVFEVTGENLTESDNGSAPQVIVRNVTSAAPFCYDPPVCTAMSPSSPTAIRITLSAKPEVAAAGTTPITLSSDVELRNGP